MSEWIKYCGALVWGAVGFPETLEPNSRREDLWFRSYGLLVLLITMGMLVWLIQVNPEPWSRVVSSATTYSGSDKLLAQGFTLAVAILIIGVPVVLLAVALAIILATIFSFLVRGLVWTVMYLATRYVSGDQTDVPREKELSKGSKHAAPSSPHWWLLALAASFLLGFFFSEHNNIPWLSSLTGNLGTGFLGAYLTVLLVDRRLQKQRQEEQIRIRRVALKGLGNALVAHLNLLDEWYKAARPNAPEEIPSEVQGLFGEDYYVQVANLDFSKFGPTEPSKTWFAYSAYGFKELRTKVNEISDRYAPFLDAETFEVMDGLSNSGLVDFILQLNATNILEFDRTHNLTRAYNVLSSVRELLDSHIGLVLRAVHQVNQSLPVQISPRFDVWWRNDISPIWGSGRLDPGNVGTTQIHMGPEPPQHR